MKNLFPYLFLLVLCSCGGGGSGRSDQKVTTMAMESEGVASADAAASAPAPTTVERKIIKEGSMRFETSDIQATRKLITESVKDYKGYISRDDANNYSDKIEYSITLRVPADKFEALVEKISEHAGRLDSKDIKAEDVTEEFIDISARIKTKKELENRYREILKDAKKVEDILAIEREIGNLRSEIESIEGRLKYLETNVAFSTLTVSFYEHTQQTFGFGSRFGQAMQNG